MFNSTYTEEINFEESPDETSSAAKTKAKILVVDDEASIRLVLGTRLTFAGYEVASACDGDEALAKFSSFEPNLIILDLKLPKKDGFEVCTEIRKASSSPIIILSAAVGPDCRIQALELGADDFIAKPFSPSEIEARIKAILRRTKSRVATECSQKQSYLLAYGGLCINLATRQVHRDRQRVRLTGMEYNILEFMAKNEGQILSRQDLLKQVWSTVPHSSHDLRVIDVHVSRLRQKVERDYTHPEYILTARGRGYMFTAG